MQSFSVFTASEDGLRPACDESPETAALLRMKVEHEAQMRAMMKSMEDNAVTRKEQGNLAMQRGEFRHALKEYSCALRHAQDMVDFLELDKQTPMNGYQLRALARGMPLPQKGPWALSPFRAVVLTSRALAFLRLDAYAYAAEDAKKACELEPKYLKAWIRRACALAAQNQRSEAVQILDEALEKACSSDLLREQVCKLVVNLRSLVNVEVKPPQKDLPVVYKDAERPKSKKTWREVVQVPLSRSVEAPVHRHELRKFLAEDWKPAQGGARWAQTKEDISLVVTLPRKPKVSEVQVSISPQHLRACLCKDAEQIVDAELIPTVQPSECSWQLEQVGKTWEMHFSLRKQSPGLVAEAFR